MTLNAQNIENTLRSMTLDSQSSTRFANALAQQMIARSRARVQRKLDASKFARNERRIAKISKQLHIA